MLFTYGFWKFYFECESAYFQKKISQFLLLLFTFNSRLEAHAVIYNGKNIADKN